MHCAYSQLRGSNTKQEGGKQSFSLALRLDILFYLNEMETAASRVENMENAKKKLVVLRIYLEIRVDKINLN